MLETETVITTGVVENFLQRANRRHMTNLVFEYASAAAGVGAIGALLLLIVGTQVMNWYWPVLLFAVALAAGLYRARAKRLSRYQLAQTVDARLGLQDRISTLVFFRESGAPDSGEVAMIERQTVERLQPERIPEAVPVHFPKYGYACAALAMAAGGLLAIRYGVLHTMSLERPLARFDLGMFQPEPKAYAATKKTAIQERWEQQLKQLGITPEEMESPDQKGLTPTEMQVPAGPDPDAAPSEQKGPPNNNVKAPAAGDEQGEKTEGGEKSDGQPGDNNSGDAGSDQKGGQPSKQQNPSENAKNGQSGPQDGLMNKMRDALSNLLNKMKSPSQQQDQQQSASNNPSQQQQNGKQQQAQQQGMQSQGKQQGEGAPSQDQQGADQDGDKAAGDKSKSGEKSADRPGQQDAKSGMGQQDGEKAIREAQQLAAMGKLSEIIGKRSQQITGEMTVEVSSGKQQLKTQWSEKKALHADTGAEVNRDEIPLAYQSYIQRYFEEVRKTPGGSRAKKEAATGVSP